MANRVPLVRSLGAVASEEQNRLIRDYAMHLVDPEHTKPAPVPSGSTGNQPTGLVTSCLSFDVTANMSGTGPDVGRFGFIAQPTFGDSSDPSTYKVALVNNNTASPSGWPQDLSNPANFVNQVAQNSLTMDPIARSLLQPPPTYYQGDGESGALTDGPLGSLANYTIDPATDDSLNANLGAPQIVFINANADDIKLPTGQWCINYSASFVAANTTLSQLTLAATTGTASVSPQFDTAIANTRGTSAQWIVTVHSASANFHLSWTAPPSVLWFAELNITPSWARPDQLVVPDPSGYPLNGGPLDRYVPVAMSVLVTFTAPELTIGGDIACAELNGESCAKDVFTVEPRPQVGQLLDVESLRRYPGKYDGKLCDGCYQIWTPETIADMELRDPVTARDYPFPCIAVAGKVAPNANVSPNLNVARVMIYTTYQFTSDVKLFDLHKRGGTTDIAERALKLVATFPRSSMNGQHWENIKAFARKIGAGVRDVISFVGKNKAAIASGVSLGLSLL